MPILFANLWQTQNISIMCGTSNSSVVPRIMHGNINGGREVLVTNISISSKNRMTISILFMKFNLYGLWIAWIQEAAAEMHLGALVCVRVCNSVKDSNKIILEKERTRNVVKALIIDAMESHLLLKPAKCL